MWSVLLNRFLMDATEQNYKNVYDDLETKETKGISGIYPTASLTDKKIDLGLLDTEQSF